MSQRLVRPDNRRQQFVAQTHARANTRTLANARTPVALQRYGTSLVTRLVAVRSSRAKDEGKLSAANDCRTLWLCFPKALDTDPGFRLNESVVPDCASETS